MCKKKGNLKSCNFLLYHVGHPKTQLLTSPTMHTRSRYCWLWHCTCKVGVDLIERIIVVAVPIELQITYALMVTLELVKTDDIWNKCEMVIMRTWVTI